MEYAFYNDPVVIGEPADLERYASQPARILTQPVLDAEIGRFVPGRECAQTWPVLDKFAGMAGKDRCRRCFVKFSRELPGKVTISTSSEKVRASGVTISRVSGMGIPGPYFFAEPITSSMEPWVRKPLLLPRR